MKKTIITLLLTILFFSLQAQYNNYKNDYDIKSYQFSENDFYNPQKAVAWAVIPGFGHYYADAFLRGLVFELGVITSGFLIISGSLDEWASGWDSEPDNSGQVKMAIGGISLITIYTLNFFDAARVAKIKNMHLRNHPVSFYLGPFMNRNYSTNYIGLELCCRF